MGGLLVELDELQHFNRYRAMTLTPERAVQLPWRADYLTFCADHEATVSAPKGAAHSIEVGGAGCHRTARWCPTVIKNIVFRYGETPFDVLDVSADLPHHFRTCRGMGSIAPR